MTITGEASARARCAELIRAKVAEFEALERAARVVQRAARGRAGREAAWRWHEVMRLQAEKKQLEAEIALAAAAESPTPAEAPAPPVPSVEIPPRGVAGVAEAPAPPTPR